MARKMTEWPSKRRPLTKIRPSDGCKRRCRSLGGGPVVRFPRIWMSSGECRVEFVSGRGERIRACENDHRNCPTKHPSWSHCQPRTPPVVKSPDVLTLAPFLQTAAKRRDDPRTSDGSSIPPKLVANQLCLPWANSSPTMSLCAYQPIRWSTSQARFHFTHDFSAYVYRTIELLT